MSESVTEPPLGARGSVLIVQPDLSGHRATYVRHLVEAASPANDFTLATTHTALASSESESQLASRDLPLAVVEVDDFSLDAITALARRLHVEHIVAPDGDGYATALARRRAWTGPRLTLLIMRPDAQPRSNALARSAAGWAKRRIFSTVNRLPNVRAVRLVAPYGPAADGALDPVELSTTTRSRQQWRTHFDLDGTTRWAVVVGVVTPRKCPDEVLDALAEAGAEWGLLLAGPCDPTVLASTKSRAIAVKIHDRYLTDEELDGALVASDVVVAAHLNEGPSGIVAKAMALGAPTVVAGAKSLKEAARCAPALVAWAPLDSVAIATAIRDSAVLTREPVASVRDATAAAFAEKLLEWPT